MSVLSHIAAYFAGIFTGLGMAFWLLASSSRIARTALEIEEENERG